MQNADSVTANYFKFYPPVGEFYNRYFSVPGDFDPTTGVAALSIEMGQPSFVAFNFGKNHYCVYVEPGDSISAVEEVREGRSMLRLSGRHSEANSLYNRGFDPEYKAKLADHVLGNLERHDDLEAYLRQELESVLQPYLDLLHQQKLSERGYTYFSTALYMEFFARPLLTILTEQRMPLAQAGNFLQFVFDDAMVVKEEVNRCANGAGFLASFASYLALKGDFRTNLPDYQVFGPYRSYGALAPSQQELCLARVLILQTTFAGSEFDYGKAFAFFKDRFKTSAFIPYLESGDVQVNNRIKFHTLPEPSVIETSKVKVLRYSDNGLTVADSVATIHSLEELIKEIGKGSSLYVDVWATWCMPCILEFDHVKPAREMFLTSGVEPVYISIDKPEMKARWLEIIQRKKLYGLHVFASAELAENLRTEHRVTAIPRYMLINPQGEIINSHAPRPGNLHLLEIALSGLLIKNSQL